MHFILLVGATYSFDVALLMGNYDPREAAERAAKGTHLIGIVVKSGKGEVIKTFEAQCRFGDTLGVSPFCTTIKLPESAEGLIHVYATFDGDEVAVCALELRRR